MPWQKKWIEEKEIDRGGQGIVIKLHGKQNPKDHAVLKRIVPKWRGNKQAIDRLRKEVETLIKLNDLGASVPKVYDSFIEHEEAEPFVVMEFINGTRFDKWLKESAPVSPAKAVEVTLAIAKTIQLCHEKKIGHRDIKPANIILKDSSVKKPYILDFGISFDSHQTYILTKDGDMFWNEFLILPECQDGQGGHRDLRSDITALVGIFFSCLTGYQPGVLRDAIERAPHRRGPEGIFSIVDNPRQEENLMWFFDKGFSYRTAERFQTLDEFVKELNQFGLSGTPIKLDLFEQYRLFDLNLKSRDRSVQIALLKENYMRIRSEIDQAFSQSVKNLSQSGASLSVSGLTPYDKRDISLPEISDYLGHECIRRYNISHKHSGQTSPVILAAFGVQMQIIYMLLHIPLQRATRTQLRKI